MTVIVAAVPFITVDGTVNVAPVKVNSASVARDNAPPVMVTFFSDVMPTTAEAGISVMAVKLVPVPEFTIVNVPSVSARLPKDADEGASTNACRVELSVTSMALVVMSRLPGVPTPPTATLEIWMSSTPAQPQPPVLQS